MKMEFNRNNKNKKNISHGAKQKWSVRDDSLRKRNHITDKHNKTQPVIMYDN